MEEDKSKTIEVFKGSRWEAESIKNLLFSNGIGAMTKSGAMNSIAPFLQPDVSVMVSEENYEVAKAIIAEVELKGDKPQEVK